MRPLSAGLVADNVVRRDGQGRVMLELARRLAESGHDVCVYSATLAEELRDRVSWVQIRRVWSPQIVRDFTFAVQARRALARRRHDVVCTMGACAIPVAPPVCYYAAFTHRGWRSVWGEIGYRPDLYRRVHQAVAARRERRAVARASSVIAISDAVAGELRPLLSGGTPVTVVPGGVEASEFEVSPLRRTQVRGQLGIPEDAFVIILVGEYATGRKGLEYLARAAARSDDRRELILVHGRGPRAGAAARLEAIGLAGRAVFCDPELPVAMVLAASDLVCVPSIYEPFSLVVLEAAAASLPVIVSARAGAAAHFQSQEAALVVEPTDTDALRAAIDSVKWDRENARALGARGREVAGRMSWERASEQAAAVIEETALGGRHPRTLRGRGVWRTAPPDPTPPRVS